eukprot:CAMPEP_0203667558 /NCGR_PEP_ID=MMETSP0090-20130426/4381_1 /ASSEMBLY_ACC=CAM_ASM_001088 /TAXON_ID=426623 /ORGANISM="Chaetoceros affinis, Strain CCMP159" /LENGTH=263 /DNA_ID=CAMNT_0050531757 /DNA_START=119 /DNA_END=907 /DNA_ORIENTATION=-
MSWLRRKNKEDLYKYDDDDEAVVGVAIDHDSHSMSHSLPTDRPGVTNKQFKTLFWLNLVAFFFQAGSTAGIIVLIDEEKTYPFYTNYPTIPANGRPGGPDSKEAFSLNVGYLSAAFLALSALDHFLVCSIFKGIYEKGLSNHRNVFRWIEYSFSASIMRILVGILSGVTDMHMMLLQFGLTACTMIFGGLVFELENKDLRLSGKVKWYIYWLGFIPHIFSWTIILGYFFYSLSRGDPPAFVYAIIIVIFILDLTFAIILGLQW